MKYTHLRFSKAAVILAFVVVLNLFFNYALSLVYPAPVYEAYIPQSQIVTTPENQSDCLSVGGQWTDDQSAPTQDGKVTRTGYCDPEYKARQAYEKARDIYERNVFVILIILGVLSIVLSVMVVNIILIHGFAWGGVLSLMIASTRYWSNANNLVHVLILSAALGALIWLAIKKFSEK